MKKLYSDIQKESIISDYKIHGVEYVRSLYGVYPCTVRRWAGEYVPKTNRVYYQKYYKEHKDHMNQQVGEHYRNNKTVYQERFRSYYIDNKISHNKRCSVYYRKNKNTIQQKQNIRNQNDPLYLLKSAHRWAYRRALTIRGTTKTQSSLKVLGCTPEQFRSHIEKLFKPGMNWSNYGRYNKGEEMTWHLDHIIPIDTLTEQSTTEDIQKICHYTNTQPLWADENISKSNKLSAALEGRKSFKVL